MNHETEEQAISLHDCEKHADFILKMMHNNISQIKDKTNMEDNKQLPRGMVREYKIVYDEKTHDYHIKAEIHKQSFLFLRDIFGFFVVIFFYLFSAIALLFCYGSYESVKKR